MGRPTELIWACKTVAAAATENESTYFADVQALAGRAEAELDRLGGLAGQGAAEGPAVADVGAHGRVDVGLETVAEIEEGG